MAEAEAAVTSSSLLPRIRRYARQQLRLQGYLAQPGDGRRRPQIPSGVLLWAILMGCILRECSFHAVEALARSRSRARLGLARPFGDDSLGYLTERLDPAPTRTALVGAIRQAKRNKAFDDTVYIGLLLDGTSVGRVNNQGCPLCRPHRDASGKTSHYDHHFCLISVIAGGLSLPCDVEPYGSGDSEYAAGRRLLQRAATALGRRFATHVVVDAAYARAPFLEDAGKLGLRVIAALKSNLPELYGGAQRRFKSQPPHACFRDGEDQVEVWDADDFVPWETLAWPSVRVLRYRQTKPNGKVHEAYWLTDFPQARVSSQRLYRLAKSRWDIENHGFNDGKNRYGMDHICHHHQNSLLIEWLLISLALVIERLFRLRYLHRGRHPKRAATQLLLLLWLDLGLAQQLNTG